MKDNIHFELNLYEMNNNNVGLPYTNDQLPKPNLCIPVFVKLTDRLFEIVKNALYCILLLSASIIILFSSYKEESILMLLFGLPMLLLGFYLIYNFVLKFISIKSGDELILIKESNFLIVYKKSKSTHKHKYDMDLIKGVWLYESYVNGGFSYSSICMSSTPYKYQKMEKIATPYLLYPDIHPVEEVNRCIDTIIIYDFISKYFPDIIIGYDGK